MRRGVAARPLLFILFAFAACRWRFVAVATPRA
jgi:hypothetical protein